MQNKFDKLPDLFERYTLPQRSLPHPRSPGARASNLSFFDEVTEEQLEDYTEQQIETILSQRQQVCLILLSFLFLNSYVRTGLSQRSDYGQYRGRTCSNADRTLRGRQ